VPRGLQIPALPGRTAETATGAAYSGAVPQGQEKGGCTELHRALEASPLPQKIKAAILALIAAVAE